MLRPSQNFWLRDLPKHTNARPGVVSQRFELWHQCVPKQRLSLPLANLAHSPYEIPHSVSSFIAKKLDNAFGEPQTFLVKKHSNKTRRSGRTMATIRRRVEAEGERLWRLEDFADLPFSAAAQALSRLTRQGLLERLSKGLYYSTRQTAFGKSRPNPAAIQRLASRRKTVFPSGLSAANLLGFTTQTARKAEVSTSAMSLPRKLVGETIVHTRRPEAWAGLSDTDASLLDFLRRAGRTSELSPEETIRRTISLLSEDSRFERLFKIAPSEPPRVRAMLGAIGQQLGQNPSILKRLRQSLNPFSRFDFGLLAGLRYARNWQARGRG